MFFGDGGQGKTGDSGCQQQPARVKSAHGGRRAGGRGGGRGGGAAPAPRPPPGPGPRLAPPPSAHLHPRRLLLATAVASLALPAVAEEHGFLEDASANLNLRNFFFNRNYTNPTKTQGGAQEWTQSFILDAQRQLFSAQQSLITDRLAQLTSEVNLYKALGGGWNEQTAKNEPVKEEAPALKLF
ncbi:OprD family outer membrane porin [Pseudomonas lurida]|nr:OprD family outer membrane porin [Pseudomonas lurida]